ncbi:Geranylgeranyl transferase type-2 subunit alpha 1 [Camellia lanceoleosa]|uniref:Geranylgeranyl transferase type-2 subunit alpha 1 n=1 Tax=Camellia lanceoleosa TaxID=1840588 RepID=A0ACC0FYF5_9ERIC|nr:Geranylgeranyl transferase type-2 subunit alpha 1 [Camellia lanceoleosa]
MCKALDFCQGRAIWSMEPLLLLSVARVQHRIPVTNSYTKEALDVNAKLLDANPEYLTVWNYRKFAVEYILSHLETDTEIDLDSIKSIYSEELRVTERALAKNYRSYGAWYHRKWVLSKGHSSVDQELQLLGVFLKKDSRNFHAWNYQRFIAALKNRSDEEELHFTTDLINENFSNYSSWHNCSVILSHFLEKRAQGSFSKEKVRPCTPSSFLDRMIKVDGFIIFGFLSKQSKWRILCWFLPGHLMVVILMYQQMVSWILVLRLLSQVSILIVG